MRPARARSGSAGRAVRWADTSVGPVHPAGRRKRPTGSAVRGSGKPIRLPAWHPVRRLALTEAAISVEQPGSAADRTPAAVARLTRAWATASGADARAAAVGFGFVVLLGFNDGGYYARWWVWTALGLVALATLQLLLGRRTTFGRLEWVSVGALSALSLWMLLSAAWGIPGTDPLRESGRGLMYLAGLVAFLLVVQRGAVRAFLGGILAGIVTLISYGLFDRFARGYVPDPFEGSLLAEPVGYANALGVLAGIGVLLGVGMLRDERSIVAKGFLVGAACVSGVGLVLTNSRGAWAATAAGIALLGVLRRPRSSGFFGYGRPLALVSIVSLVVGLWAAASAPLPAMGDRPSYWRVALEDAATHPLVGSGAGSFDDFWVEHRPIPANVRDAHSLYLEVLAELGPVGLVLLLALLAAPLVAAARLRARPVVAAAAAGYLAYLVHAGLDWDWEYPVVTLAGLASGAALLIAARTEASSLSASRRAPRRSVLPSRGLRGF